MYILVVETSSANNMMGKKVNINDYLKFWLVSGDRECTLNPELDIRERKHNYCKGGKVSRSIQDDVSCISDDLTTSGAEHTSTMMAFRAGMFISFS